MPDITGADRAAAEVVTLLTQLRELPAPDLAERAAVIDQASSELAIAIDRLTDRPVTGADLGYLRQRVDLIRDAVAGRSRRHVETLDALQTVASATVAALAARTKV